MKKILALVFTVLICSSALAQRKKGDAKQIPAKDTVATIKVLPAPFKGGIDTMFQFFKDNLKVSQQIIKAKASGTVIIKFSTDTKGYITSIVVFYADDYSLIQPVTDALRRTNAKWVIPAPATEYDFVAQFIFNYKPEGDIKPAALKSILDFYQQRKPIIATDQVPLKYATMLPTIVVNYE